MSVARIIKRITAFLLCALLLTAYLPCVYAAPAYPVVFVPGYTGSRLYRDAGTPDETRVWKLRIGDEIKSAVKSELPWIAFDGAAAAVGMFDPLFDTLEPYVLDAIEPLRMNDDGTSKYNVTAYPHSVEDTRLDQLKAIGYYPDHDALVMLGSAVDSRSVYCCTLDWRLGQLDNAAALDAYIRDVLRVTGADKVDLMGVSFGGQVVASYLSVYGASAVSRVVLQCPALDGSSIVPQLLSGEPFSIAWTDLMELVRAFRKDETDYASLVAAVPPSLLTHFLRAFIDRFMLDLFVRYGSVWDLVPLADYPALRDSLLADGKFNLLREKTERYHTEIAVNIPQTLRRLSQEGVPIAIVAGYGYALAVDNCNTSDGVIDLESMTGADCALQQETLAGSRLRSASVSADGMVDAAAGYLPDRTWYVSGMLHCMGPNEEKISELLTTLLLTDSIRDVHSSPEYPQFLSSQNPCRGVFCAFSGCSEGYCTRYSTKLTIRNLSQTDSITVDGISCRGADLRFGFARGAVLQPGETLTASVSGVVPAEDLSALHVTVRYVTFKEKYSVAHSRTQSFRYAADEHFSQILTGDVTDAETIADTPAVRTGFVPFRAVLARIGAVLYALLIRMIRVLPLSRYIRLPA